MLNMMQKQVWKNATNFNMDKGDITKARLPTISF